jgi:hypothetical protein
LNDVVLATRVVRCMIIQVVGAKQVLMLGLSRNVPCAIGSFDARAVPLPRLSALPVASSAGLCDPLALVGGLVVDVCRSRSELIADNVMLRQQLIITVRAVERPIFLGCDRQLLVLLARFVPLWRSAFLVKPEKVLRWQRERFRLWWAMAFRARRSRELRLVMGGGENPR